MSTIDYQLFIDRKHKIVNVIFYFREKKKYYIKNIHINGNDKTAQHIIRRECEISEGDFFNQAIIDKTKYNIENLGLFKRVAVISKLNTNSNTKNIEILVEEKASGALKLSTGYNNIVGLMTDVSFSEQNLFGIGKILEIDSNISSKELNINIAITNPQFFYKNLSFGYNVFIKKMSKDHAQSEEKIGFSLRMTYLINDFLYYKLDYTFKNNKIITNSSNEYVKSQQNKGSTSSITQSLIYKKSHHRKFLMSGYYLKVSQSLAGIGGYNKYIKHEFEIKYFQQLLEKTIIFHLLTKGGNIFSYNLTGINIIDNFFIGEEHIRGFQVNGIGPRYRNYENHTFKELSLGGKNYYSGTLEIQFPIGIPYQYKIKGAIFSDMGMLFFNDAHTFKLNERKLSKSNINDSKFLRISYGGGVLWHSPLGPIRLDYGIPLRKEPFDITQYFRFSFFSNF